MDFGHPQHSLAGVDGQLRNASTYGDTKLPTTRVYLTFRSRNIRWVIENMLQNSICQTFGTYYKDLIAVIKELRV